MHYVQALPHRAWQRSMMAMFALMLALTMPLTGYAKASACRGDPIIDLPFLRAQSIVEIGTALQNVDRVEYIYHLPITKDLPVTYDDSPLAAKEVVKFVYDATPGTFRLDTIVYLKPGVAKAKVTAWTTVTEKVFGYSITKTVSGFSGQTLSVSAAP